MLVPERALTNANAKTVLIVTEKFDPHADHVIKVFKEREIPFFRLNTDDFHVDMKVAAMSDDGGILLEDRWNRAHRFPHDTLSVWHRKPVDPAPPEGVVRAPVQKVILHETLEFLGYLGCDRRVRWINNPHDNRYAQRKFPQIRLARELGLRVPRTLITNDPARAREFHASVGGRLLCKSMKEQGYVDETAHFIFSRKVASEEFEAQVAQVAHCPTFFQEYTEKDHELRITIVGDEVFCCRLDSQAVSGAETDWRQVDPSKVPHRLVDLDAGIVAKLKQILAHYGLRYGAFDMIVTPEGEYVFLELNPNGQWLWIELMTGAPLTAALVRLLTS
jgi:hypothetical protein